jgi:hypothetical protein
VSEHVWVRFKSQPAHFSKFYVSERPLCRSV